MTPTDFDNDDENNDDEELAPQESKDIRQLRKKATKADELARTNAEMAKELAIHKAGLSNLSADQIDAVKKLHEGDDMSAEAILKTVQRYGISGQQSEETVPANEIDASQRVANASAGASTSAPVESPQKQLEQAYEADGFQAGPNFYAKYQELGGPVESVPVVGT